MTGHHLLLDADTDVTCMHERDVCYVPACSFTLNPTLMPVQPPWLRKQCNCKVHCKHSDGAERGQKVPQDCAQQHQLHQVWLQEIGTRLPNQERHSTLCKAQGLRVWELFAIGPHTSRELTLEKRVPIITILLLTNGVAALPFMYQYLKRGECDLRARLQPHKYFWTLRNFLLAHQGCWPQNHIMNPSMA